MPTSENDNAFNIVNEEVKEILGAPPKRIIRYGSLVLLLLIIMVLTLSAFIEYPQIVQGTALVEPLFKVINIHASKDAQIVSIHAKDGAKFKKGDLLLVMTSHQIQDTGIKFASKTDSIFMPVDGTCVFLHTINEKQVFSDSTLLMALVPEKRVYKASITIPNSSSASIQFGQKTYISLPNFPQNEYGDLAATVASRPNLYGDSAIIEVNLINGSLTTYKKELLIYSQLQGTGEITVSEKKLYRSVLSFLK